MPTAEERRRLFARLGITPDSDRTAGASWVRDRLERRDVAVVDARSSDEFSGRDLRARHGGHIPDLPVAR